MVKIYMCAFLSHIQKEKENLEQFYSVTIMMQVFFL
jgi:hypothetical protein